MDVDEFEKHKQSLEIKFNLVESQEPEEQKQEGEKLTIATGIIEKPELFIKRDISGSRFNSKEYF